MIKVSKSKNENVRKLFVSIPDELAEWLDKYIVKKYHGVRGGKSLTVIDALNLLRDREEEK